MIDEPQHNLDGSSDAEPPPHMAEPPPYQPEPLAESLPPGQTFEHTPGPAQHELPSQDLQSPFPEAPMPGQAPYGSPEQNPYISPFGQTPPAGQLPPAAPPGGGTSYGMPHAWPATSPAPAPPPPVTQAVRSEFPLRTVLLVAVPLCLIAIIVGIILFNNNNANDDAPPPAGAASTGLPAATPVSTPAATTFAPGTGGGTLRPPRTSDVGGGSPSSTPTPPAAPVTLSGGGSGGASGGLTNSGLAGRWVSKKPDFYQFNADGTGSRGAQPGDKSAQNFNWTVMDHHITLFPQSQNGAAQQETVTFSWGPDANSVFLKQSDGRYREYALVKNSDVGG